MCTDHHFGCDMWWLLCRTRNTSRPKLSYVLIKILCAYKRTTNIYSRLDLKLMILAKLVQKVSVSWKYSRNIYNDTTHMGFRMKSQNAKFKRRPKIYQTFNYIFPEKGYLHLHNNP